ncbi:MAG: YihY/virulence factor BrkB family protein [Defluviitaleaceae bacterium]|nr:YihY/virulence factor BrkB family protein [Defluviitaleaceae bacterium]
MNIKSFVLQMARDIIADETIAVAGELTYKLMLSLFPLVTFLFSLLGFLNLDIAMLDELAAPYLPEDIHSTLVDFIHNLTLDRNAALLSLSFAVTLLASSSGFRAMMRGINKAYGTRDERPYLTRVAISVALTLIFTAAVVAAIVAIIFRDAILSFFEQYDHLAGDALTAALSYLAALCIMLVTVTLIYKLSARKRWRAVLPGSFFTVFLWLVSSQLFNFYVNNFPAFSLYGSIAGAFIMLLWLNVVSVIMLLGAQLNAHIEKLRG